MKSSVVRDFMTPISDFPRIAKDASMMEAILALESVQQNFLAGKTKEIILLVEDDQGKVLGKISQSGIIRGLEPGYENIIKLSGGSKAHALDYVINSMKDQAILWGSPLRDLCATIKDRKVEEYLSLPVEERTVQAADTLDKALNHMVLGRYRSMFVKDQDELVGILQFPMVFKEICNQARQCSI